MVSTTTPRLMVMKAGALPWRVPGLSRRPLGRRWKRVRRGRRRPLAAENGVAVRPVGCSAAPPACAAGGLLPLGWRAQWAVFAAAWCAQSSVRLPLSHEASPLVWAQHVSTLLSRHCGCPVAAAAPGVTGSAATPRAHRHAAFRCCSRPSASSAPNASAARAREGSICCHAMPCARSGGRARQRWRTGPGNIVEGIAPSGRAALSFGCAAGGHAVAFPGYA